MKRSYCVLLMLVALSVPVWAVPTFTLNREVDYTPSDYLGNPYGACPRALGGVVQLDAYADGIIRISDVLTATAPAGGAGDGTAANCWGVFRYQDLGNNFATGESWQGICYDGANYFTCGIAATGGHVLQRITDSGNDTTRWASTAVIVTPTPAGAWAAPAAVAANKLVLVNYDTGALQFVNISTGAAPAATADGAAIANPNATGLKSTGVFYYNAGAVKKLFVAMASDTITRRVDVFNTDGTAAGTTYQGTFCAGVTSNVPVAGQYNQKWTQVAADPTLKLLAVPKNVSATDATQNGIDVFDLSTVSLGASPFTTIQHANFGVTTKKTICAPVFVQQASSWYLMATHGNHWSLFNVSPTASVDTWSLY